MDASSLLQRIRDAGVVGQGGAGFPAHVKFASPVETVIANGCECEPLLFSDQALMQRHAEEIVEALEAVMAAVGARRGIIAIKQKYSAAGERFERLLAGRPLELARLENFYPAGDEHVLVHELLGRSIPPLGLPRDVDAVVSNVGTLFSIRRAMEGIPVTRRWVTVTGEVKRPSVLEVPIGTAVAECIAACGGPAVPDPVLVLGGPMMGRFAEDPDAPRREVVTKTTSGVLLLPRGHYLHRMATLSVRDMQKQAAAACIQCRYCTDLCPRHNIGHGFETHRVMRAFGGGVGTAPGTLQAFMCSECGVCELFACPMRLSPRRINALFKARFREQQIAYEGRREVVPAQSLLNRHRKIPVARLAIKLDLLKYLEIHPVEGEAVRPTQVTIPLQQHAGAAAVACVRPGERVAEGQLIGEIPEGRLGARIHASIAGDVTRVDTAVTIQGG